MNKLIQAIQLADKYSRLKDDGTKESWPEVVERVIGFLQSELIKQQKFGITQSDWDMIRSSMLNMDVLPSMRVVQMAGPALARDNVGAYNCAYIALNGPEALAELLYIMMQGTGIGFSVEEHVVAEWPEVWADHLGQSNPVTDTKHFTIDDSTDGWVQAYRFCIEHALNYENKINWDFSQIRPSGTPLKTKGGYASGPEPFAMLLDKTHEIIRSRRGSQLTPFDIHRLATLAGSIVMVGGVRRAAQISLSDVDDLEMRHAKTGVFWLQYPELSMANNSAVIHAKEQLAEEWPALRASGTGERGLFNPYGPIPERRDKEYDFGTNPCGEILLRSKQFCNLSIAVARPEDDMEKLQYKVRVATLIGTIQSCLTHFPTLSKEWKENCEDERLLGVDITGTMDCPLLQHANDDTALRLQHLKEIALYWNGVYADALGINKSKAITCNKPSGNSSQLLDCSSGIHPRYSPFYIRRLRIGRDTPLAQHLLGMGVPVYPEVGQSDLGTSQVWVFEVPAIAPKTSITRAAITALQQLEYWKMWKLNWTEHNPSCTIYVNEHEWDAVYQWVWDHWDIIGGLSFLPKDNHVYQLAPYQEIGENEYYKRVSEIKWDGQPLTNWAGEQAGSTDAACGPGGWCEI